jgi:glucosylceramidase
VPVDDTITYQRMDGFGAALTESSAHLLMALPPKVRTATLRTLFDPASGAGIDLVRVPLGASDFALSHYTYDDLPAGETDPALSRFSLAHDDAEIVPVLREALKVNPQLRIMGTPWSAPAWMKTSGSLIGGSLLEGYTDVYAAYLVRTVQELRARGLPIRFLTLGNEPKYTPWDYPGMRLSVAQQAALAVAVSDRLAQAGVTDVALIGYDHNWDDTDYPTSLLADEGARAALAGTAFHCYAGSPEAQVVVHDAAPDKGIWFTECTGGSWATSFAGNLGWNAAKLMIGATRSWARSLLLWNLALDPQGGPHAGGCEGCRGVLTVDPRTGSVTRNVEYDVLALAGGAVRPGAVRVATPASVYGVQTVGYRNPDGSHVLTAYNGWQTDRALVVDAADRRVGAPLPAGSVVTLTW